MAENEKLVPVYMNECGELDFFENSRCRLATSAQASS